MTFLANPSDIMVKFTAPSNRIIHIDDENNKKDILSLLSENPGYTMPQLAEQLGISRKAVAARLKKMKDTGQIERFGSNRKEYWKIKRQNTR